jgi:predicted CopG family antitoxin
MTKNITIEREAYEALLREKGADESFSDVIMKLASRRAKLSDSAGRWTLSDREAARIDTELKQAWRRFGGRVVP